MISKMVEKGMERQGKLGMSSKPTTRVLSLAAKAA